MSAAATLVEWMAQEIAKGGEPLEIVRRILGASPDVTVEPFLWPAQ